MTIRAFIAGCSGHELSSEEAAFFREAAPWGFILFRRNVDTPRQVRALCDALRDTVGRADAPILIDQEGGRVQRMGPPHWPKYPSGSVYGRLHANDPLVQRELARLGARLIAHDLRAVGITVDCLPVLDVPSPGAHDVIGDRAYGRTRDRVAVLGRAAAEGLLAGGVLPVVKHMPGHGRALVDSHEALPVVRATAEALEVDVEPFRTLSDAPMGMTCHVVFDAWDAEHPATLSSKVIAEIIRGRIGFDGLLMTDDLSMHALTGTFRDRTQAAFDAGIDVGLHCNGVMDEMRAVAEAAPLLSGRAAERAGAALARLDPAGDGLDVPEARAQLAAALAAA